MNILTAPLPAYLTVCGEDYPINTDFRTWIKIEEILADYSVSSVDKVIHIFSLAFTSSVPSDAQEALFAIAKFLSPFHSFEKSKGKANEAASPLFSFSQDGGFIYAAFLSQYGIDLTSTHLHWWRFLSLFSALCDCKFTEIVKIRGINLAKISDPNQKSFLRRMKKIYRLKSNNSDISSEIEKIF